MKKTKCINKLYCAVCISSILLGGCDFLLSPTEKINSAIQPSENVMLTKARIVNRTPRQKLDLFEKEYNVKLKVRALICSEGYTPSRMDSIEKVAQHFQDTSCFRKKDKEIAHWLKVRLIGIILAKPPLKPISTTSFKYSTIGSMSGGIHFADHAGVVLLRAGQKLTVVDTTTGQEIFQSNIGNQKGMALSPNGRLLVTLDYPLKLTIRDLESGEKLVELPKPYGEGFFWLGNSMAIYNYGLYNNNKVRLVDFSSGKETIAENLSGRLQYVLHIPGTTNQFIVKSGNSILRISITGEANNLKLKINNKQQHPVSSYGTLFQGFTSDLNTFYKINKDTLQLISLKTQNQDKIIFNPFKLSGGAATSDPDKIILYVRSNYLNSSHVGKKRFLLYSIKNKTVREIKVDDPEKTVAIIYIPSLKKNFLATRTYIEILDKLSLSEASDLDKFLGKARMEEQLREMEVEDEVKTTLSRSVPAYNGLMPRKSRPTRAIPTPRGLSRSTSTLAISSLHPSFYTACHAPYLAPKVVSGPLWKIARTARIEAIGVYEGKRKQRYDWKNPLSRTMSRKRFLQLKEKDIGKVKLHIRKTSKPVILVLSSYESVNWVLDLQKGANLAALLVSGYEPSQVSGTWGGTSMVMIKGSMSVFKCGSQFNLLDKKVHQLTGRQIEHFQGKYTGDDFYIK